MRVFTLICGLLLVAIGAAGYFGWGQPGDGPRDVFTAIPAFFGAAMLLGTLIALLLRRTGLQLAFITAIAGGFSGLGRLAPFYLKETLDWQSSPTIIIAAMSAVSLFYVLVAGFCYLFVRRKPVPAIVKAEETPPVKVSNEAEGESEVVELVGGSDNNLKAAGTTNE